MADNVKLSGKTRCLNFLEILLIHITLPTWDCVNDLKIASIAISEGHHRWGCSLIAPILLNFCFTTYVWSRFDNAGEKRWSWLFLVLMVWPQWRACKVMYEIVWRGDSSGFVAKEKYKRDIACLEPFLEAAPQVLTKTAILAQRKVAGEDLVVRLLDEGLRVSYMVSLVGTGLAMVKFLKEGPCHTMIGGKGGVVPFILAFISTFGTLGVKVALLKMMATGTKGDEMMTRVAVWATCCLMPQFVVAVIALGRAFGSVSDVRILLNYPELFAAPLFNPATFGRVRDMKEYEGKLAFSLRWTFVNMLVTVSGIALLALYVHLDSEVKWSPNYVLTLMVVMAMAMVWMVPLMMASKYPDSILSVMYQQGVLDIQEPDRQFILKWQNETETEEVVPVGEERIDGM